MIVGVIPKFWTKQALPEQQWKLWAENTSDGVIAPFLFMAVFGPLGGTFYKAVNTMDSMIGYRNDKYILFGRTAAKLDDVLNFIPARISGCLLTLAAYLLPGADGKNAWRIFLRDRRSMTAPILLMERQPVREPFICVLQEMPGTLGFFTRNSLSEIMTGRSSRKIYGSIL